MLTDPQLVDVARFHPSCCTRCRTSVGPWVDLGFEVQMDRAYLCLECLRQATEAGGGGGPQAIAALEETIARLEDEVESRCEQLARQAEVLGEAEQLRRSVAWTLKNGAVGDKKTGEVKLRAVPGEKAVDVKKSLVGAES